VGSKNNGKLQRFAVTGLGLISPLGIGVRKNWQRLVNGESAVRYEIKNEAFIARVDGFDMPETLRQLALAFIAAEEAAKDANLKMSGYEKSRIGFSCGESKPNLFHKNYDFDNGLSEQLKNLLKIEGQMRCVSAACATGTLNIIQGCNMIEEGVCDAVICGTAETSIHPLYVAGFKNMGVLSKKGHCPFDKERDGFSIGEGAGFIVIEDMGKALLRGAKIYCELAGKASGVFSDMQFSVNSSDGMERIIRNALKDEMPDYVHMHGTGTKLNDYYESLAVAKLQSSECKVQSSNNNSRLPRPCGARNDRVDDVIASRIENSAKQSSAVNSKSFFVSSTKAATGHMLGVSGMAGAIFSIMAINENKVPPTINFNETDIPFNLNYIKNTASAQPINSALSLSFGFGGQGTALFFKRE